MAPKKNGHGASRGQEDNATAAYQKSKKSKPSADDIREEIRFEWTDRNRQIASRLGVSATTVGKYRKELENSGEILPRIQPKPKNGQPVKPCLYDVSIWAIQSSPENDSLYDPVREDCPAFLSLVKDIRKNGILQRIICSTDGYIISGHRRYAAAKKCGLDKVPVEIDVTTSREMDPQRFVELLASHNRQRVKTTHEAIRERIVGMEDAPWQHVRTYRRRASQINGIETVRLPTRRPRSKITQKISLKNAIVETVYANRKDWPLSDRKIFYLLLNVTGLLRNDVKRTPFEPTDKCYHDVTNMLTRLRFDGSIPFDCITDETRPVIQWDTHKSVGTFVERELENLFSGYWRDLQQSQPNHIELLVEKNTVASSIKPIAAKYTIPMTSGRGYSSLPPRKEMVDRFRESGREKLIIIVVSDLDPEGCDIPAAFGVSLRDDFDVFDDELVVIKSALTKEQVQSLDLHEGQFAKEKGARYKRFVQSYGQRCWELEAVPTETLREIVEAPVRQVMDIDAFEKELESQTDEQQKLGDYRLKIKNALSDIRLEDDGDD